MRKLNSSLATTTKQLSRRSKMNLACGWQEPILSSHRSTFKFADLEILDENVLKLTPDRLISMDIHSRCDILAITGCDRKGTIGLVVKVKFLPFIQPAKSPRSSQLMI